MCVQDTRNVLEVMRNGHADCKDWFVQAHLKDLYSAEYRVLVTGVSGTESEECFPSVTGWQDGVSAAGVPMSNMVFQQMVANDDFYLPRLTTEEGVQFDNHISQASRGAMLSAAKQVRAAVVAGNPVCMAARNVMLRVDVARVLVEIMNKREDWRVVCVVNEPNGLVLSAALGYITYSQRWHVASHLRFPQR